MVYGYENTRESRVYQPSDEQGRYIIFILFLLCLAIENIYIKKLYQG